MNILRYEKKFGSYYLLDDRDNIRLMTDEIAIVYSIDEDGMSVLHKHGSKKIVEAWFNNKISKLFEAGLNDLANEFRIVFGEFEVDDLNKIINTSGYISEFLIKSQKEIKSDTNHIIPC